MSVDQWEVDQAHDELLEAARKFVSLEGSQRVDTGVTVEQLWQVTEERDRARTALAKTRSELEQLTQDHRALFEQTQGYAKQVDALKDLRIAVMVYLSGANLETLTTLRRAFDACV